MNEKRVVIAVLLHEQSAYMEWREDFGPAGGCFMFPGGKPEGDETVWVTMVRELREEFGITPTYAEPLAPVSSGGYTAYPFLVTRWEGAIPPATLDAGDRIQLVSIEEATRTPWPGVSETAKQVLARLAVTP